MDQTDGGGRLRACRVRDDIPSGASRLRDAEEQASAARGEMFHGFTEGDKTFSRSLCADTGIAVRTGVLTVREDLGVCTSAQDGHRDYEFAALVVCKSGHTTRLSDIKEDMFATSLLRCHNDRPKVS